MSLSSGEGIPNDAEQQAANSGTVTDAQKINNLHLEDQIAKKVLPLLDEKMITTVLPEQVQNGFDAVQERARQARSVGLEAITPVVSKSEKKKGFFAWLRGE